PSSPITGFFPVGPAAPNAFTSFHQSPRDTHAMYEAASQGFTKQAPARGGAQSKGQSG
ncbi:hypothetical protein BKA93DRAFT_718686, partial [Sparassis latifolia]